MKAVIFDMDGVLVDSEPLWREVEVAVLRERGLGIRHTDCEQTMGLRIDEAMQYWFDREPWGDGPEGAARAVVEGVSAGIRARGSALPGSLEAWHAVRRSGWDRAIATSSPWRVIEAVMTRLDLECDVVCSAADEAAGKPDPAVYLTAARRLGHSPEDCLAIEDSAAGAESARRAGMRVLVVQPVPGHLYVPMTALAEWFDA